MDQRWRAAWVGEEQEQRAFTFDSLNNRMIAHIDFKLKFNHTFEDERIPEMMCYLDQTLAR
jgi:hypothetical protein